MLERITVKWNRSKGERGPTAVGERDTQLGDYVGKDGKTYKCVAIGPSDSGVYAVFEEVDKLKEFPFLKS
jgi:hypothetical protein